jgi:hypothetical protein
MEVRMAACVLASLVAAHTPRVASGTAEQKPQPSAAAAVVGVAA